MGEDIVKKFVLKSSESEGNFASLIASEKNGDLVIILKINK